MLVARKAPKLVVRTSGRVQSSPTAIAFEVFGFLVRNENLEIVEVALAVIAPGSLQLLVEVGVPLSLFGHFGGAR